MAFTVVEKLYNTAGSLKQVFIDLVGPASYLADGQSVTAADLGYRHIYFASSGGSDNGDQFTACGFANTGAVTSFKVAWFVSSTGAEVADAVDLSARKVRVAVLAN